MDKLFVFAKKYSRIILSIIIIFFLTAALLWFVYRIANPPISVVAEFIELGPLYKKMPVYYKGYKIGNTSTIKPSKDFKTTLVTIVFYPDELKLPENIAAKVKKLSNGIDYINLEYPKNPSHKMLKNGSVIHGMTTMDIQSFMSAQVESGALGSITGNVDSVLAVFSKAGEDVSTLLQTLTNTVNENRNSINKAANNIRIASDNIKSMTEKLDIAISQENMQTASENIGMTVENIQQISKNVQSATENLNQTMAQIDSTLCQLNGAATNINAITAGVRKTLNQNMAAFKIFFGRPINDAKCAGNCYSHR